MGEGRFQWSYVGKGGFVRVKALFCRVVRIQAVFNGIEKEKVVFCRFLLGKGDFSGLVWEKVDLCG